jgi:rhodanese-related sulfurtransferase
MSVVVITADFVIGAITNQGGSSTSAPTPLASPSQFGVVVPAKGGYWTNVEPDQLAQMLEHKDFTLVNVKTPYVGEIDGTDLYIPYDEISSRKNELPQDKSAEILVYCRSGVQSAQAAQTLLYLGYTNVWNLDGGMNAWQASGRALVNKKR